MNLRNLKREEVTEDALYRESHVLLGDLITSFHKIDKYLAYNNVRNFIKAYFRKLFLTTHQHTEEELIDLLKQSNVKSETIKRVKDVFDFIEEVEYNDKKKYEKEELFTMIEDMKVVIEEIYDQTKAQTLSKEEKITTKDQKFIMSKFLEQLKLIKKEFYSSKKTISNQRIVKVTEYYNALSYSNKNSYKQEFNYFCRSIPHLFNLIDEAKKIDQKDEDQVHPLISEINRLFLKLEDKDKKYFSKNILQVVNSEEEKLNIYIMVAYSYIHQKKFLEIGTIYKNMLKHYDLLEESKKKYYHRVIKRVLSHLKTEKNKLMRIGVYS